MIETLAFVLTGLGLTASIVYYANILSNANKTRELQLKSQELALETRQAQFFFQMYRDFNTKEAVFHYIEIMSWHWDDYQDFEMKYGSDNNPQAFASRQLMWSQCAVWGKMLKKGLVDVEYFYNTGDIVAGFLWFKFKDVIIEQRKRYYTETYCEEWEYLVSEVLKYRQKIGDPWTPPETLTTYVPDQ